jgi:hypothetical protein
VTPPMKFHFVIVRIIAMIPGISRNIGIRLYSNQIVGCQIRHWTKAIKPWKKEKKKKKLFCSCQIILIVFTYLPKETSINEIRY